MGKNIIAQARGRGGPTYRAKSFRYQGRVKHNRFATDVQVGKIIDLLHCAGHSAPLAQVQFESGENNLMIAHEGMKVGDAVQLGGEAAVKDGNVLPLKNIPEGTLIFNIESIPGDGGKFVRSSGVFAKVVSKFGKNVVVQLPSKKRRPFPAACRASIGVIAAGGRPEKPLLKAGNAYYKMKARNKLYPRVSASAMNAVDHPFGNKRTSRKSKSKPVSRHAPPGRKVGTVASRRTGRSKK